MAERVKMSVGMLILRAGALGLILMMAVPVVALLAVLAVGHLAGACGPGSSGGCEMGAAMIGMLAVIPSFILGAVISLVRDLRQRKA